MEPRSKLSKRAVAKTTQWIDFTPFTSHPLDFHVQLQACPPRLMPASCKTVCRLFSTRPN